MGPRTPIEETLAEIWGRILGVERVGIHDNFFELGGHSLLATRVISRVLTTLPVEIPLRSLFEAPTVDEMALVIVQNLAEQAGQEEIERMLVELEALAGEQGKQLLTDEDESSGVRDV